MIFGKTAGFNATLDLSSLDGKTGFRIEGLAAGDHLGNSVSSAGDVNGDGFDDVIVGAQYADSNGTDSGSSYVVFGKSSGFSATLDVSTLDGTDGFRIDGEKIGDRLGFSLSNAGDTNGDGFDDVVVSTQSNSSHSTYVILGKASGFSTNFNLSSLDGTNGFRLDGSKIPYSVSNAGDVNGDGFDDLIVGDSYRYGFVVFGKASGFNAALDLSSLDGSNGFRIFQRGSYGTTVSSAGDINGDGFDDVLINQIDYYLGTSSRAYVVFGKAAGFTEVLSLASIDGNNGFSLRDADFVINLSTAGDVNGDGFDDVIVSDSDKGKVYVVYGKASGFDSQLFLTNLDGGDGFQLSGAGSGFPSVLAVSNAGDVNNDGFDDLMIGNRSADSNGQEAGSSYILFGADFVGNVVHIGTPRNDILIGNSAAERFEGGDGNDSLDGKGGADVFYGGTGKDTISVPDLNFLSVDGGTGTDILKFTDRGGVNVNLADFQGRIKGIETIEMTGDLGNNKLTLSLQDLKSLSDTTTTFTINGFTGDRVFGLGSNWTDQGIQNGYHRYTNQGTVVRIDPNIRTDAPNPGMIYLSDLDGVSGFRLDDNSKYTRDNIVSNAGDVNGDGYDDVIVNAYGSGSVYDNPFSHIYVVFGKPSGFDGFLSLSNLDSSSGFRLGSPQNYNSISNAGDVNGDGFDDLIIGSGGTNYHGRQSGSSYVVFGKASGFDGFLSLSNLDGNTGFRLDGVAAYDVTGYSVSEAGDVNGDGFDDLIVGAFYADPNGSKSGSSYVVFGKATGFNATMDLSTLDGDNGFRLDGLSEGDRLGTSISNAGDVNGDGFGDVIVSAPGADPHGADSGSVYVIFGKATGFNSTMNLSSLDVNNGSRLDGLSEGDRLGTSISNAGDVNGDGFGDVIVSAPGADLHGADSGSVYVVFGKATDFNTAMDLSHLDGNNGFRMDGLAAGDKLGISVSSAGDVNGDDFDDVIVITDNEKSDTNYGYVVFGKATGFGAEFDLSNLDGTSGFSLKGVIPHYSSNPTVSSSGDINGDGFDDLMIGDNGNSYIVFGAQAIGMATYLGTAGNDSLTGTSGAERFEGREGNDRMIGHGGMDTFYGDSGDDYIRIIDLNFKLIDGSTGKDTLGLGGSNMNLDLSAVGNKIHAIETIYLYGMGDNTLTLTAEDLINLSDSTNTLKVNGSAGDHIVGLSSGWTDEGVSSNGYFHTYTQGDAVLVVGANVTTDFV